MSEFKICRICSDTNVRMHNISESVIQEVYEKITNKKVQDKVSVLYACYICYCQLKNCHQLILKSEKSEEMLRQVLTNDGELNLKSVTIRHRQAYGLLSPMITATLEPVEILTCTESIKSENITECSAHEIIKYESDDQNRSEQFLHYEVNEDQVSEPLNDYGFRDNSSSSEDDVPLKSISAEQTLNGANAKKTGIKNQKKKDKMFVFDISTKEIQNYIRSEQKQSHMTHKSKGVKTNTKRRGKEDRKQNKINRKEILNATTGKSLKSKQYQQELKQTNGHKDQRENTIKLLLNSNGCLFTSYRTKFGCDLCPERFLDIKHLREHTKIHSDNKYLISSINHLRGRSYKNVDISNLTCSICEQACHDLFELQTHLTVSHTIQFSGTENFLTPYKLENGLQCILCQQTFNTFLRLSIHMNSHSTNNVCEICGMSYINRSSLRLHVQAVHREKKCTLCPSTFHNNSTKMRHMRSVHRLGDYKRYCQLCEKTFRYTYMLVEHRIKEHGAKRTISECVECGKKFSSVYNLKIHIRSVHIRERNYPCSVCDMRFFTKCDQRRHARTHEDVRSFCCAQCEARFKTKDSWRRHLKRQHAQLLPQT